MNSNQHSIYGPSCASRWRHCPGSVHAIETAKENKDIPTRQSSRYADEGSEAHQYADDCLTGKITLEDIPEEFRFHLQGYIAHCQNVEKEAARVCGRSAVHVFHETQVPLFYRPQDRGTVDHGVICPAFIHISDLKYGKGVKVDAADNDQALIYATSWLEELEIMGGHAFVNDLPVFLSIYQPRHFSFSGGADVWELTVGQLREEAKAIQADYENAKVNNGKDLHPSEKTCKFCDVKGICLERARTSFGGLPAALDIEADFDFEGDTKEPLPTKKKDREELRGTLTPGQVAWICQHGKTIKKIVDDVIDGEAERIRQGGELRHMKLIPGGLGNRTWVDKAEAEKVVRAVLGTAEAYKPRELITAPQTLAKVKAKADELSTIRKVQLGLADEETMNKSKTKCLIHRPEGKPKLVPLDNEAEALTFTAPEDDFDIEN